MWRQRNIWWTLQGAGSPCRKQGCEIRRWYEGVLASAAEDSSLPGITLARATPHPSLGTKARQWGQLWARLRGWTSWVSSLVPPQHGSFCLLSPPRSKARSELLRGWDPGSQFPDEATGWAKTGTRGSSGGRGRHLDLMGVGLWNGAVVGGFPASHCWRHSGPLPAAPQALKSPDGCSDQGSLGQGSTYPGSGRVRAGDVEF